MRSALPKVLHPLAGQPMLSHVIAAARQLNPTKLHLVIGHGAEQIQQQIPDSDIHWVEQTEQLGTGHAVQQVLPHLPDTGQVLVLYGDVPLIQSRTLEQLLQTAPSQGIGLLTVPLADPAGYGRIVRDAQGQIQAIVEQKDASPEQQQIQEINTGILTLSAQALHHWLPQLSNDNAQNEYYLTDLIALCVQHGQSVAAVQPQSVQEIQGVNSRQQLAELERVYQRQQAECLMQAGVSVLDPARLDIRGQVNVGQDTTLDVNVILSGECQIGSGCSIGPNVLIHNSRIGDNVTIKANSVIEDAVVHNHADIGPFARLRPGTDLGENARIGNFVETKNAQIGQGSKINHLSYVGDAEVGQDVNIGAGTITCNYDGANKHKTIIKDRVFIGSDTQLVAPVTVEEGATIGAGSTITRTAPAEALSLSRTKQRTLEGWQRPTKNKT